MTRTRSALSLAGIGLMLAGCGAAATSTASTPQTARLVAAGPATPTDPSRLLRPHPPIPPTPAYAIVESPRSGGSFDLLLVGLDGRIRAATTIPGAARWSVAAGPEGAYWTAGSAVFVLTARGSVSRLGAYPANASGLLISPTGDAYAYSTSTVLTTAYSASGIGKVENRILVQPLAGAARVVADRISDPATTAADTPGPWQYELMSWTNPGILFLRVATLGCGCGAFDMDMLSAYAAFVDPLSERVTDLTSDPSCPLSALGSHALGVCFHTGNQGGADQMRLLSAGTVTEHFSMSGANVAGDALFSYDGAALAYETVPTADAGCGGDTTNATLHVMDLRSGTVRAVHVHGLHEKLWTAGGPIYADLVGTSSSSVVSVDPATLAVHQLWSGATGTRFVGLT